MHALTPREVKNLLVGVAPVRPVFIWGPPGIGKTAIVTQFGEEVGYRVISLLGSQLAPEDLIGVPRIVDGFSVFAPPRQIADHAAPIILFVDEFNASSPEVQKAFYSLITEQRVGEFKLPSGSIVVLAGNRAQDNAITRTVSSALINRVLHVEMRASHRDWLEWAYAAGIHHFVTKYIETRPDHLFSPAPKTEQAFSTPRSWHILSDALGRYPQSELTPALAATLAAGTISPNHAHSFGAFVRGLLHNLNIEDIINGRAPLPTAADQRDVLTFVVHALRAQLTKELPAERGSLGAEQRERLHSVRRLIGEIARIDEELLMVLLAREEGDGARNYPAWFLADISSALGRLAERVSA
jgi:MoxR-like ATPase